MPTGTYQSFMYTADTLDDAQSIGLGTRAGITLKAGWYGLLNNGLELGKFVGVVDDNTDLYDVADSYERQGNYAAATEYMNHAGAYDLAGALLTSVIPATGALKVISAAKAGNAMRALKFVSYFDKRAKTFEESVAAAYKASGSAADVGNLKLKLFAATTAQQFVEGALVTGAVEATQNYGEILNNEGLSAVEKISRIGEGLLIGGLFQAGIGGILESRVAAGGLKKTLSEIINTDEIPLTYRSLSPRVGNVPVNYDVGTKLTHVVGEMDRIQGFSTTTELQKRVQASNLDRANTELNAVISDMFPKTDTTFGADIMRKYVRTAAETPDGRKTLLDNMSNLKQVGYTLENTFDSAKILDDALQNVNTVKVSKQTLSDIKQTQPSSLFDGENILASTSVDSKTVVNILDSLPDDLATRKQVLAHATLYQTAIGANKSKLENEITKFALDRNMSVSKPIYEVLTDFYKYSTNTLSKTSEKFPALHNYFKTLGDDTALAIYGNTSKTFLDTTTGIVSDIPIKHLADLEYFTHAKESNIVRWKTSEGTDKIFTANDINSLTNTTDMLEYQAKRILASNGKLSNNILSKMSVQDGYILENMLSKTTDDLVMPNGSKISRVDALDTVSKLKGQEYNRLVDANPTEPAANIYNSIGYNDISKSAGIMLAAEKGSNVVTPDEIINPASMLTKRKSVALIYGKPTHDTDTLSASLMLESQRASMKNTFKAVSAKILGFDTVDSLDKLLPTMPVEAVIGYGTDRFLFPATAIGEYGSNISKAAYIGNWIVNKADEVFTANIKRPMIDSATTLAANKAAAAEWLALREWFYRQSEPFYKVDTGLYAKEAVAANIQASIKSGTNLNDALKGYVRGTDYNMLETEPAKNYMEVLETVNKKYIASHKINVNQAYGKVDSFDLDAMYIPPRNFKFTSYLIENSTNPLAATSENVYRVVANSKDELEQKVREAMDYATQNKLNWIRKNPSDIGEFEAARGKFEWSGKELEGAYANSYRHKQGAVASFTPETDISKALSEDLDWAQRNNLAVHRAAVELNYADEISQYNTLSRMAQSNASSDLSLTKATKRMDDYGQLLHTMLGSDAHGFSTWKLLNNNLEDYTAKFVTTINKSINAIRSGSKNKALFEQESKAVTDELAKMGIGLPMEKAVEERLARELTISPEDIRNSVSWLNHVQSSLLLRLDATDSMMNVIGNMIKTSGEMTFLKKRYELASNETKQIFDAEVQRLFGNKNITTDFGNTIQLKSIAMSYKKSIGELYTDIGKQRIDNWHAKKLLVTEDKMLRDMYEEIRIKENMFKTKEDLADWKTKGIKAATKAYEFATSPSRASNLLTQYTALDIAETLGKALNMHDAELDAFMFKFSRSANAVYSSTQKPRLFQGSAGIAMSLYQGYMFHMMANVFRYADAKVKAAPAMIAALNSTFFGATSLPGFSYINNTIAGLNPNRVDLYDAAATSLGQSQDRDMADFIMYGAGSFVLQQNMYTRGGLTPRSPILIPSSIQDVPLLQAFAKTIGSASETAHNIAYGAPIVPSLWDGLVNMGLNRPLTGLADVLRGKSVDSQYNTVMYHEDMFSIASAFRLAGMRPLNEQVARDMQFRQMQYKARDANIKKQLGEEIRVLATHDAAQLENPDYITSLAKRYLKAGGSMDRFDGFLADQLSKNSGDIYDRMEKAAGSKFDELSRLRDIYGSYE